MCINMCVYIYIYISSQHMYSPFLVDFPLGKKRADQARHVACAMDISGRAAWNLVQNRPTERAHVLLGWCWSID